MDICLNISSEATTGPVKKARRKKSTFLKPHVKRLEKKLKRSERNNNKGEENSAKVTDGLDRDAPKKTRIKQKSLAAIVAKNLARSRRVTFAENKEIKEKESSEGAKPDVAFVRSTPENVPKTILARVKKNGDAEAKASLSDIFSKNKGTTEAEEILEKFPHARNVITAESGSSSFKDGRKRGKRYRDGEFSSKSEGKEEKPARARNSGKISSLFGNNPEVPNIGQRLVKPVDETLFDESTFEELGIHSYAVSNLRQNMGITKTTTVQKKAIPVILSGRNVLVRSQTGSGKTLAYGIPIVETLQAIRPKLTRNAGLKALVVVPTRELALQTYECFLKLVKPFNWIVPGYLVGGEKRKAEKARLRRGCTVLVATPGRLLDHIRHTEALRLNDVRCFVLDEADRMLDMGYERDISGIVEELKKQAGTSDEKSAYDPMALLRNGGKMENQDEKNNEEKIRSESEEENNENDGVSESEENGETDGRPEYHSGTDSDEDPEERLAGKKKKKKESHRSEETEENAENTRDTRGQTILLSATLTAAVEKLAGLTMKNPVFVDAARENLKAVGGDSAESNEDLVVPQGVSQSYIVTPPKLRMVTLSAYIAGKCQMAGQQKILIFMATQDMIDYHADALSTILGRPNDENDEDSDCLVDVEFFKLHGSMSQKERTEVFKTFRQARSGVLLCTDVASRGLDMPRVDTVVQYTGPLSARDYVHRIGRTGRAGTCGSSTIFLTPPEIDFVRMLESRRIRIKREDMKDVLGKLIGPLSRENTVEAAATVLQNKFENLVTEDKKLHAKACKAYVSWIRFYASYPREMREIFNRRDLHLGHYAKSFALRDAPQKIGGIGKSLRDKEPSKIQHDNRLSNQRPEKQARKRPNGTGDRRDSRFVKKSRMLCTSEYASGLEPLKKMNK